MGMLSKKEAEKSQLAVEICEILARAQTCADLHQKRSTAFTNWYLVLRVDENAAIDVVRKQYHKFALQLHPDKNKQSRAETAFKLVYEAYFCLSDDERRAAFDSELKNNCCVICSNIARTKTHSTKIEEKTSKLGRIKKHLRDLRAKLRDEAAIIEKCLTVNAAATTTSRLSQGVVRTELPVFNPSNYRYKGYPQSRAIDLKKLANFRAGLIIGNRCTNDLSNSESPVFQYRSESTPFVPRCASTRGQ